MLSSVKTLIKAEFEIFLAFNVIVITFNGTIIGCLSFEPIHSDIIADSIDLKAAYALTNMLSRYGGADKVLEFKEEYGENPIHIWKIILKRKLKVTGKFIYVKVYPNGTCEISTNTMKFIGSINKDYIC